MSGLTGNNILAGASGQGGYEIEQSLRFNDDDSAYLSRTPASASNQKTWTWSCWAKKGNNGVNFNTFCVGPNNTNDGQIYFNTSNKFVFFGRLSSSIKANFESSAVYRDVSSWYHIVVLVDTTQAVSTDRVKIYINGSQVTDFGTATYPSLNDDLPYNSNSFVHYIGKARGDAAAYIDGYLAEVNFIDGQALTPSDFGETNLLTNQWIPKKYVGTYGTNGFYLNFSDSASLGADSSGNGNNFTPTNLAATDQNLDSPTNNFCTLNPLSVSPAFALTAGTNLSEGNLRETGSNVEAHGTFGVTSGKWYFELCNNGGGYNNDAVGYFKEGTSYELVYRDGALFYSNGSSSSYGATWQTVGDIVGVALDLDAGTLDFYKNNVSQGTAVTGLTDGATYVPMVYARDSAATSDLIANFGQDSSFAGTKTAQNNTDGNGKGDFYYTPPSGYLALCTANLPDPSIADPTAYFNTVLYTGNGSTQSISGVGFQPDFVWLKERSSTSGHRFTDAVRGAGYSMASESTDAENYASNRITSFDSDGFSLGNAGAFNESSQTYVAWNWKADNTSGSSNTDGSTTSTVSANTTAGFSIVTCTTLAGTQTVGHGLSQAPDIVIQKSRNTAQSWYVYYDFVDGSQDYLTLNSTAAAAAWGGSAATSTVFYENWSAGVDLICYCFHSVEGYSKFGSYIGNGANDGPFVYTGFRPAFVMIKRTDSTGGWSMADSARPEYNPAVALQANTAVVEFGSDLDITSNGFKVRTTWVERNASGGTYIYMAFAESPFKYSNAR